MNRKGEFLARNYIISIILFGMVSLIGYLIVADISGENTGYNIPNMTDQNFRNNYDTLSTTTIYQMQNATQSSEGLSTISTFTEVFKASFSVISLIFGSLGLVNGVFASFAQDFGVPSVIANIVFPSLLVIIIALLVFIIISSVSQGKL